MYPHSKRLCSPVTSIVSGTMVVRTVVLSMLAKRKGVCGWLGMVNRFSRRRMQITRYSNTLIFLTLSGLPPVRPPLSVPRNAKY